MSIAALLVKHSHGLVPDILSANKILLWVTIISFLLMFVVIVSSGEDAPVPIPSPVGDNPLID